MMHYTHPKQPIVFSDFFPRVTIFTPQSFYPALAGFGPFPKTSAARLLEPTRLSKWAPLRSAPVTRQSEPNPLPGNFVDANFRPASSYPPPPCFPAPSLAFMSPLERGAKAVEEEVAVEEAPDNFARMSTSIHAKGSFESRAGRGGTAGGNDRRPPRLSPLPEDDDEDCEPATIRRRRETRQTPATESPTT